MSTGKWQKEIPTQDGRYWIATQDGLSAGLATVVYHPNGKRIMAGLTPHGEWEGWWWSEPVIEPKAPPPGAWLNPGLCLSCAMFNGHAVECPEEYTPEPPKDGEPDCKGCSLGWPIKRGIHMAKTPGPLQTMYCKRIRACTLPPEGWTCSRTAGHEGPCAASPTPAMRTAMAIVKTFGR